MAGFLVPFLSGGLIKAQQIRDEYDDNAGTIIDTVAPKYNKDLESWKTKKSDFENQLDSEFRSERAGEENVQEFENSIIGKIQKFAHDRKLNKSYRRSAIDTWNIDERDVKDIIKKVRNADYNGKTFDQLSPRDQDSEMSRAFVNHTIGNSELSQENKRKLI